MNRLGSIFLWLAALTGCTLAPPYEQPKPAIDGAWPTGPAYPPTKAVNPNAPATPAADLGWKDFFTDPRLRKLIARALINNNDLRVAALNVASAQAQYRIEGANLYPTVNASATGNWERTPASVAGFGSEVTSHTYSLGVGFTSYELDLFGHIRSLKEQALEQYFALDETRTSTQITLISEVAIAYLTWLADQEQLQVAQETLKSQRESYNLVQQSFNHEVATELDLRQAETTVRTAEANIAQYTRQVAQDLNALVLLVGEPFSDSLQTYLGQGRSLASETFLSELPAGLPSDLLIRRPDIRAAERNLIAANAKIGAARAAFFPTITLTAAAGTESNGLSGLFANGSGFWQFAPSISLPIFDAGVNGANLDVAKISKKIYVAQYQQTIQTAFREVADALAGLRTYTDQVTAEQKLVNATSASYHLYLLRYRGGIETYQNVLTSERDFYNAQQNLITTRLNRFSNLVTLYKVLGGGWTESTVSEPAKPTQPQTGETPPLPKP